MSLAQYVAARHLVVSQSGDAHGFVDDALAAVGEVRSVALTSPNFSFALATLAETDFVAALPERFAAMHGPRFNVVGRPAPLPLPSFTLSIAVPKVALNDAGIAWLVDALSQCAP
jgi:DNA-binding transcriptional LysR family regulator